MPPAVARGPVGSYPTVSPLLHRSEAVWFLWHFLSPVWAPGCYPVPCSPEPGLSSEAPKRSGDGATCRSFVATRFHEWSV